MIPFALVTNWPHSISNGFDLFLLLGIALFKFTRGNNLRQSSQFFDRLGLSIIVVDYLFAAVYVWAALVVIFPSLIANDYVRWSVRIIVFITVAWAAFEARRASSYRKGKMTDRVGSNNSPKRPD